MPLYWDDDEEDLTEVEYRKKNPSKVEVHEEITSPMGKPVPKADRPSLPPPAPLPPLPSVLPPLPRAQAAPPPLRAGLSHHFQAAPLKDRFAAFFLDSLVGFYLYYLVGYILLKFFGLGTIALLHQNAGRFGIHLGLTIGAMFFYYLLMEAVFGATLGKFFCRLRVIEETGQPASLGNIFIRNFLRIVDYPLFFLIAIIAMESSPYNQRLGDRAAKTLVIKKTRRLTPAVDLSHTPLASTLSRLFAEAIDLGFVLLLLYGIFLSMRPTRPLLSFVLWVSLPVVFILYFTFLEFLCGSTPGKAIFKRSVVLDNGEPPDGTSSLIRNIFRPFDYLLGYPLMVLSKRKQRLGDMAADTLVVARPPSGKAKGMSLAAVGLAFFVAYLGFSNPMSVLKKDYGLGPWEGWKLFSPAWRQKLRPGAAPVAPGAPGVKPAKPETPAVSPAQPVERTPLPPSTGGLLKLEEFYFSAGPEPGQIRQNTVFRPGDLVYAFFKVQGFIPNDKGEGSVSEDLTVEDPAGKVLVNQPKIVEWTKPLDEKNPGVLFANQIKLSTTPPPGKYRVIITIRDQTNKGEFSFEKFFEIK